MRKLKFRAWDKRKRIMVYRNENGSADYWDGVLSSEIEMINALLNDSSYEFMQFTGLKDRNGREIYEGDIAKLRNRLFLAYWNSDLAAFYWEPLDQKPSYPCFNIGTVKDMEVIGNLYEHPNLLICWRRNEQP